MGLCSILVMLSVSRASSCSQVLKREVMSPVAASSYLSGRFRQHLRGVLPVFLSASTKIVMRLGELKNTFISLLFPGCCLIFHFLIFLPMSMYF